MTENWKQKAYEKLQRDGWRQGRSGTAEGPCCAGGAIAWAITGDPRAMYAGEDGNEKAAPALAEFKEFAGIGFDSQDEDWIFGPEDEIIDWNDSFRRTEAEVLSVFKRLAETEGAQ